MRKIFIGILNSFFTCIIVVFVTLLSLSLFGIKPYIVQSGSMEPYIKTGSLAFVNTNSSFNEVQIDDVISYSSINGALVTHRVINIEDGMLETKGDNNDVSDGFTVSQNNFFGTTLFSVPMLGFLFAWAQTKRGIILSATFIVTLLLLEILLSDDEKSEKQ